MNNCKICGAKLYITNYSRYFCPNCGIVEINQEIEEIKSKDENPSYIG